MRRGGARRAALAGRRSRCRNACGDTTADDGRLPSGRRRAQGSECAGASPATLLGDRRVACGLLRRQLEGAAGRRAGLGRQRVRHRRRGRSSLTILTGLRLLFERGLEESEVPPIRLHDLRRLPRGLQRRRHMGVGVDLRQAPLGGKVAADVVSWCEIEELVPLGLLNLAGVPGKRGSAAGDGGEDVDGMGQPGRCRRSSFEPARCRCRRRRGPGRVGGSRGGRGCRARGWVRLGRAGRRRGVGAGRGAA